MLSCDFTKFYYDESGAACTIRYCKSLSDLDFDEWVSLFKQTISSDTYQEVELKINFLRD